MKRTEGISQIEQVVALMDFLTAMGYEVKDLSVMEVMYLKHDIIEAIEKTDLDPYAEFMRNEEG